MLDKVNFQNIQDALAGLSELIKKFTEMLKNFVASWKKVPTAANGD